MAVGKNTVSLAEKKARILKFFQEEHTMYNMKELEKLIPKKCGISSMLVKELVQKMIDEDGLISVEKCGNINVYWSFHNQIQNKFIQDSTRICKDIENLQMEISRYQKLVEDETKTSRSETGSSRGAKSKWSRSEELNRLKTLNKGYQSMLSQYNDSSKNNWTSDRLEIEKNELRKKMDEAEAIVDNIHIIVGFISSRYGVNLSDLMAELELPQEYDEFSDLKNKLD